MALSGLAELCRLCLTDDGIMFPIFESESSILAQKIFECTSIEIEQIEGVPSSVCEVCKSKLIICCQFIRQCVKSDETIRRLYERHFILHKSYGLKQEISCEQIELIDYDPCVEETQHDDQLSLSEPQECEEVLVIEIVGQSQDRESLPQQPEDLVATGNDESSIREDESTDKVSPKLTSDNSISTVEQQISEKVPCISVIPRRTSCNTSVLEETDQLEEEKRDHSEIVANLSSTELKTSLTDHISENEPKVKAASGSQSEHRKPKPVEAGVKKFKRECTICGVWQINLKQHMAVHSGVKKHICQYCNKAFAQKGNLTCHLNIHTGNKPHKCDQCDRAFGDPTALKMHKISHSTETEFECEMCGKIFKYRHSLLTHIRSHNDDRRHVCGYCKMAFVTSSSLKKHIRKHTGERPYKCEKCPKAFTAAGNLRIHQKTHQEKRTFQCTSCDSYFTSKPLFEQHLKTHKSQAGTQEN